MKNLSTLLASPAFKTRLILYLLQILSCDLPVIEPVNPNPSSSFAFIVENAPCAENCSVIFTNHSKNAESYEWNFGDGTPVSNAPDPVHVYAAPGTYHVSLKAMTSVAQDDTTATIVIESSATGAQPTACFTITNNNCTVPCTVTFTNCSTDATEYEWNFGDTSPVVTTDSPSHLFSAAGSYPVKLTATNESGSATVTDTVYIADKPGPPVAITVTANAGNTSNHVTRIDHESTDGKPKKILVITRVGSVVNAAAIGAYYYANQWHVFNQDKSPVTEGERFNVLVADADDDRAFVHTTSSGNMRDGFISTIDHPATNNNPIARVFVTPVWEKLADYNIHPVGVAYVNNRWEIFNLDRSALPEGLRFNVVVSTNDQESFVHTTRSNSVFPFWPTVEYSIIDDPRTNGKSDLKIFATMNHETFTTTVLNPHVTGVLFRGSEGKWLVFNENGSKMPSGVRFHIMALE